MAKKLIIAEKPSVAGDIARVLGGFKRHDDYFESDDYVVSSAVGHLLELMPPEEYEVKRGKWSFAHLPVIPPHFDLKPIEKTEARLKLLTKLIKRKDVDGTHQRLRRRAAKASSSSATSCGTRRATKPIQRLWLQSMTPAAIRDGFEQLRADDELQPLADAATCRSESDWLVGINGTRAMTAFNSKSGGFHKTPVGRVQTPTLAILVEREEKIKRFVSRDYWEVHGDVRRRRRANTRAAGSTRNSRKERRDEDSDLRAERLWDEKRAPKRSASDARASPATITEESKPSTQLSPLLFDLTSLQRDGERPLRLLRAHDAVDRAGALRKAQGADLSADRFARAAGRLHRHGEGDARVADRRGKGKTSAAHPYAPFAAKILKQKWVKPNKRIFNNAKISDHFAIIPTALRAEASERSRGEALRPRRAALPRGVLSRRPNTSSRRASRASRASRSRAKARCSSRRAGSKCTARKRRKTTRRASCRSQPGEKAETRAIEVVATQTKPPARFTEATLLTAMEGAGKLVEDEELREAMKERGLGTPATRAVDHREADRRGIRAAQPARAAADAESFSLFTLLRGLEIPELISPELTGEWEYQLKEMEHGKLSRPEFMQRHRGHDAAHRRAREGARKRHRARRLRDAQDAVPEVRRRHQGELQEVPVPEVRLRAVADPLGPPVRARGDRGAHREAADRPAAGLPQPAGQAVRGEHQADARVQGRVRLRPAAGRRRRRSPWISRPGAAGPVPEVRRATSTRTAWPTSAKAPSANPRTCDFRSGQIILQRPIEPAQMKKLLTEGKTDLLHRFISKKGRPFSAYLVKGPDGKVGFEFAPRAAKAPPKTQRAKTKAAGESAQSRELTAVRGSERPRDAEGREVTEGNHRFPSVRLPVDA